MLQIFFIILKVCFLKKVVHEMPPSVIPCIGLCVAIMLKYRRPTMSLVQKLIAVILYSGHSSKKVYYYMCCTPGYIVHDSNDVII